MESFGAHDIDGDVQFDFFDGVQTQWVQLELLNHFLEKRPAENDFANAPELFVKSGYRTVLSTGLRVQHQKGMRFVTFRHVLGVRSESGHQQQGRQSDGKLTTPNDAHQFKNGKVVGFFNRHFCLPLSWFRLFGESGHTIRT